MDSGYRTEASPRLLSARFHFGPNFSPLHLLVKLQTFLWDLPTRTRRKASPILPLGIRANLHARSFQPVFDLPVRKQQKNSGQAGRTGLQPVNPRHVRHPYDRQERKQTYQNLQTFADFTWRAKVIMLGRRRRVLPLATVRAQPRRITVRLLSGLQPFGRRGN